MTPRPDEVAQIAAKLTKAVKRALPKLNAEWTMCTGRLRIDSYGLWWGKLHDLRLVDAPRWPAGGDIWAMRLTPLGLAVRAHLTLDQDTPNV